MAYLIDHVELPDELVAAFNAAGRHLKRMSQHPLAWLRANLHQPLDHHLSFRVGNQLFFVFIEVDGAVPFDERSRRLLFHVSQQAKGVACLMPMRLQSGVYVPSAGGWGLIDAQNGESIDPPSLVSSELIVMTDWELMDFAVQVVRNAMEQEGREIGNWQSILGIDPSIYFRDPKDGRQGWVVVRGVRWPVLRPDPPKTIAELNEAIRANNSDSVGYFAWVSAANGDEPGNASNPRPLYRGHSLKVPDRGVEPV
jgi:hypothetical protein